MNKIFDTIFYNTIKRSNKDDIEYFISTFIENIELVTIINVINSDINIFIATYPEMAISENIFIMKPELLFEDYKGEKLFNFKYLPYVKFLPYSKIENEDPTKFVIINFDYFFDKEDKKKINKILKQIAIDWIPNLDKFQGRPITETLLNMVQNVLRDYFKWKENKQPFLKDLASRLGVQIDYKPQETSFKNIWQH